MKLSLVIPIYNESGNIDKLYQSIKSALSKFKYEIIFVDDGSTDKSVEEILSIKDKKVKLIKFCRNYGQTPAMKAGIELAQGEYIVTLDGDLQNDPTDIPKLYDKIKNSDYDIVTGIRKKRKDNAILTNIPSKIGNWLIRKISKVNIEDYGCTLKIFKSKIAKKLELYGELHRFIPILASIYGAKIGSMEVKHHKRIHGHSKYNILKTFRVVSDLMLMFFFIKYRQKPMHLFGNLGIGAFVIGMLIESYLLLLKLMGHSIGSRPLFLVGILLIIVAIQFFTTGFLAEMVSRIYYNSPKIRPYDIDEVFVAGKEVNEN